jgi:hypothetical protein
LRQERTSTSFQLVDLRGAECRSATQKWNAQPNAALSADALCQPESDIGFEGSLRIYVLPQEFISTTEEK